MGHHCHYYGCQVVTDPKLLTCPTHWKLVSQANKDAVWKTYKEGKAKRQHPTMSWQVATELAFLDIAQVEEHPMQERRIIFCKHKVKLCIGYLRKEIARKLRDELGPQPETTEFNDKVTEKLAAALKNIKPNLLEEDYK